MTNLLSNATFIQLHLGLGAFHRAHQAAYLQALHDQGYKDWIIAGGNIRPDTPEIIKSLKDQKGQYTLETVTPSGDYAYQAINVIKQVVEYDESFSELQQLAVDPATRIISFTVTEAGYYLDADHNLDDSHTDLKTDLSGETRCTIYGVLEQLLNARMIKQSGQVTLLNCDNLRSNGERFFSGFNQFLQRRGKTELRDWVKENTTAPNSMVDRITPRATPEVSKRVLDATGVNDPVAVTGESFIQWVIEDDFIAGRPEWEKAGVEMVDDVEPYEEAKIRLLNATHSCIAWAGTLRGHEYIHQSTLDPLVQKLAYDYVTDDAIPCLQPSMIDLEKYRDVVLQRFSNPNILDHNQRVVMDGYAKLPSMIVPTIRERLSSGKSIDSVAMLPALFLEFLLHLHDGKIPYEYQDQAMPEGTVEKICQAKDPVSAFVAERILFDELANDDRLLQAMRAAHQRVKQEVLT